MMHNIYDFIKSHSLEICVMFRCFPNAPWLNAQITNDDHKVMHFKKVKFQITYHTQHPKHFWKIQDYSNVVEYVMHWISFGMGDETFLKENSEQDI